MRLLLKAGGNCALGRWWGVVIYEGYYPVVMI